MRATRTLGTRRGGNRATTVAPWLTPIGHHYAWPPEQHALHESAAPSPWAKSARASA